MTHATTRSPSAVSPPKSRPAATCLYEQHVRGTSVRGLPTQRLGLQPFLQAVLATCWCNGLGSCANPPGRILRPTSPRTPPRTCARIEVRTLAPSPAPHTRHPLGREKCAPHTSAARSVATRTSATALAARCAQTVCKTVSQVARRSSGPPATASARTGRRGESA